ncbi:MAG TPA: hypothetical protein VHL11_08195 [Phototrophicaceae bacterium]|nr:hypothetical protein [Phototrophicaceae bacterium]
MLIIFGVIAFLLGPSVTNILSGFISIAPDQYDTFDWLSRGIVFMVLILITAMVYTVAAPKPKRMVSEHDLDKERKARIKAQEEAKKRQRQVRVKMAEDRKKNSEK